MTNKTSAKALTIIKNSEGLKLRAYLCPANVPTIGYGTTAGLTKADVGKKTITEAEAERLLKADVAGFEKDVAKLVKVPITDDQFGALVSFAYNLGAGALASSTLLKRINAKASMSDIQASWLQWNKARVNGKLTALRGLTIRRQAEFNLFKAGAK
ncbi:lysozyme [Endobacterium cereale]|uniref:lysozyme n=1 Tax=Endobacterium cereale TaxID=2663029 RepID=UPI002B4A41B8|nr:lysozyme [Endobacterium cereale]MEB2843820.1 lysozyme [Endobacterium cereale]